MPIADAPMSNKQHAVPQNIMDVEFKLIGDLTMRQFSYLLLCGILSYVSFVTVVGLFKVILGAFFALLGLGLAFVPLGERGLDDWIVSFIRAINMPTQRIWKKEPEIPFAFSYRSVDVLKQELITLAPTSSRRKLEEYLKYQVGSEKSDPLDIPEQEYIMKVREAFSYVDQGEQVSYAQPNLGVGVSVIEEPAEKKAEDFSVPFDQSPILEPESADSKDQNQKNEEEASIKIAKIDTKAVEIKNEIRKGPTHLLQEGDLIPRKEAQTGMPSITPDMHSGRKFTNLLPSQGELILPIRGERVINTSDQVFIEEDLKEKTEKLQMLLTNIRQKEGLRVHAPTLVKDASAPVKIKPVEIKAKILDSQTPEPKEEQEQPEKTVVIIPDRPSNTNIEQDLLKERQKKMEEHTEKMASGYTELGKRYQELQTELEKRKQSEIETGAGTFSSGSVSTNQLTQLPDVVSGVVKGVDGKLLADVLVIVKNKKGEAIRAVKTNSVGQFMLLTPLDKGVYTVEVSLSNNLTETFDIIPVEVKGEKIPLMEFFGK